MKLTKWSTALLFAALVNGKEVVYSDTGINGDITVSTLTVTGPVSMSSITVSNTLTAAVAVISSGTLPSFAVTGTTTNNNAPAGGIGEFIDSDVPSYINCDTSFSWKNVTSIVVSSGDWDVSGAVDFYYNGATTGDNFAMALSTGSDNTTTDQVEGKNQINGLPPTSTYIISTLVCPRWRVSVSSNMTIYLKGNAKYSSGTPKMMGYISARRVR